MQKGMKRGLPIFLAFGHDEEIGGSGAAAIVHRFESRGIKPEIVLDEGEAILDHMIPGIPGSVAMIGTSEKGFVSVDLILEGMGGHSSAPPAHTLIGEMSAAIERLESQPMPARLEGS